MSSFEPPPTYAQLVLFDERSQDVAQMLHSAKFNPIWLKWFLDLIAVVNSSGGGGGTIQHNSLGGLQGGTANEYYHLTSAQYSNLLVRNQTAPSAITPTGSPFAYHNSTVYDQDIIITAGTVSDISRSRDNITYYTLGVTVGQFHVSPGDYLRVTYSSAPTMTLFQS